MRCLVAGLALALWCVAPIQAQRPAWTVDAAAASYAEAWEFNEAVEHLHGVTVGVDRVVWRDLAVRGEGVLLRVRQAGDDPWLGGATLSMRVRQRAWKVPLFLDVGAGGSTAGERVPPRGTRFNYLLQLGGGVEFPLAGAHLTAALRWFHISNNGREGNHLNPDIQALGAVIGVGMRLR